MKRKEYLTREGLIKFISLKAYKNKGLNEELLTNFTKIILISRPQVVQFKIKDPNWVYGFVSVEGCFYINIVNYTNNRSGIRVWSNFKITQHYIDEELMKSFIEFFNCGNYYLNSNKDIRDFIISKLSDITDKIIPFFE